MNYYFRYILFFFLVTGLCCKSASGQAMREKQVTVFGFQFSPIFPNKLFSNYSRNINRDTIQYTLKDIPAYMFGMEVKHDFTKNLSFQTGINFIRRNYRVSIVTGDSAYTQHLNFIGYELPVLGMGYIRIAKELYLDGSFGACLNFYPSDISIQHYYGRRVRWYQASLLTNTGVEWRTEKSGYFYIGALFQWHFGDMMNVLYYHGINVGKADEHVSLSGNYFAVNFKYYLPQNKTNKKIKD